MKSPIVFRATFQQPTEIRMKMPGVYRVEVYHAKIGPPGVWRARSVETRVDFHNITPQSTPHTLMKQIEVVHFQKQLSPWEAFDSRQSPVRLLQAEDYAIDKNGLPAFTPRYLEKLEQERTEKVQADISKRKEKALEEIL
jgi:hypothetical protein